MRLPHLAALTIALAAAGCAAAVPGYMPPDPKADRFRAAAPTGGGFAENGAYQMTDQEQKLDCKQLTGSMTVKILQMRDAGNRGRPSAIAAVAQSAARPDVGGTTYGQNVDDDLRRDRARLETLNQQLAAKKCATFDLDAELKPGNDAPPRASKKKA
jgi:hypothetical protein